MVTGFDSMLWEIAHDYYQKAPMKMNISHGGVCIFMLGVLLSCDPAAYVRPVAHASLMYKNELQVHLCRYSSILCFELLPPITRASHFLLFEAALHLSISIDQEAPSSSDTSYHVDIFLFAPASEPSSTTLPVPHLASPTTAMAILIPGLCRVSAQQPPSMTANSKQQTMLYDREESNTLFDADNSSFYLRDVASVQNKAEVTKRLELIELSPARTAALNS
ncbi:hypothetical protein Ccrd_023356 [Cynara cardunculus var. scolymus]|uniref:Uncharacterized protein n=1 Tax=Cynara cardunculus var. scolymus TaxID=59895 RepID=A0A103XX18_CYNCS|nr:hypothetical protein Ccrd_023356 [Cynara cardunculus var. scolymus]